ncbi:uncharacterized protein E0L32_000903 [Thyridium curvatum]|uniref:SRP54-type proteins GTP-binding domain-containing protein n=1 Tax=Thyridium curvatum TaxID=1093900 RepID=A0A507B116_9PEZI|nr:uncharacterized protein E0L32_000903 [Thyridium curvatum]TPX12726.1 hypothetical protein E0L32_000903 [Thyridium curvatum]
MSVEDYDTELSDYSSFASDDLYSPRANRHDDAASIDHDKSAQVEGMKAAFMDVTERERSYGDPVITPTSLVAKGRDRDKPFTKYALLLRRRINIDGKWVGTQLEIRSPVIQAALQKLLASCSYLNLMTTPIVIKAPYAVLFQFRHEIREYTSSSERTQEEKAHMRELVQFMNVNLEKLEKEYNQYAPTGLTTCDLLWTLFRPETLVIYRTDHFQECYRVSDCSAIVINGSTFFSITAWSWDYNGISFGPSRTTLHIPEFQGARKVTELNIYPFDALSPAEQKELESKLIARGKVWRKSVDLCHREYSGPAWVEKDPSGYRRADNIRDLIPVHVDGRIFLDYKSHQEENYALSTILYGPSGAIRPTDTASSFTYRRTPPRRVRSRSTSPIRRDPVDIKFLNDMKSHENNEDYEITDTQALLAPARIRGFTLTEKLWAFFLVDNVCEVQWSENAFDDLELEYSVKKTVQSLVKNHYQGKRETNLISRKGKGLVILLYGPTGTGKTFTAGLTAALESVAEAVHLPLYYVGAGELDRDLHRTERKLQRILDIAKLWKAMVLIDEADVFLAKRTLDDVQRNGLVSVFLRVLEYHEGVVFLTTNRIRDFDSAFLSRVHLRIQYPPLNPVSREKIWRTTLRNVKEAQEWPEDKYQYLAETFILNGREIANLSRTALSISQTDESPLTAELLSSLYELNRADETLRDGESDSEGEGSGRERKARLRRRRLAEQQEAYSPPPPPIYPV